MSSNHPQLHLHLHPDRRLLLPSPATAAAAAVAAAAAAAAGAGAGRASTKRFPLRLSTVFAVSIWLAGVADCYCEARSWRDVQVLHEPATLLNAYRNGFLVYEDPLYGTTLEPTQAPTVSAMPSPAPTTSRAPSQVPSVMPSASPSASPTVPLDPYPPNDPPSNPQSWYYNYNTTKGARFGPGFPELIPSFDTSQIAMQYSSNYWSTVSLPPYPNNYWLEFTDDGWGPWKGVLENSDPLRNRCGNVGLQSPIDLVETGARCDETHEVRTRAGDFRIGGDSVLKLIEHNKLRLKYQRRNCPDRNKPECSEPDPPMADFPNGWTNDTDTLHVDFKIPSEHTIGGQRFDAEMQIFNLHVDRRRTPVQGVLIKATKDGFNYYFEEALKAFERKYSYDLQMCQNKRRRRKLDSGEATMRRRLGLVDERQDHGGASDASSSSLFTPEEAETYDNVRDELEEKEGEATDGGRRDRDLQIGVWDPFHSMLIPSIYFWRYDGSLTEPPCGEFVSWFICDVPMTISISQLERMKKVLFNHVDQDCRPTSSQFDHGVARPIQDRGGRPVWRCKPSDFGPDPPGGFV